jgi:hypothetical protein
MKSPKQIKLDELANGELPNHVIDSIGKLKLTVEELSSWKKSQPPIYIAFKQGHFIVDVRLRWSIKKFLAMSGSFIGLVWAITKLVLDNLPIIKGWLSRI